MQFKNIKPAVITVLALVVIIIAGVSFSGKAFGGMSLASLSTAKQLISSNSQDKISKLDDNQKKKLIENIDKELSEIGVELNTLNRENSEAKKQLASLQSSYSANTAQVNSLITQTQALQNNLSQQQNQLKNKNQQCAKIPAKQRQNCKQQANQISSRISATRSELNQKQATINNLKAESGKINFQTLETQIAEKQKKITELEQVSSSLSDLRRDINNSNNNKDPDNPIPGCTDSLALNWNSAATVDDGSCQYDSGRGCKDSDAINYDPNALIDDPSLCKYDTICSDDIYRSVNEDYYEPFRNDFKQALQEANTLVSKYTFLYDQHGKFVMVHPEVSESDLDRMTSLLRQISQPYKWPCKMASEDYELADILTKKISEILIQVALSK